ncbi:MAG TPA: hypothetical protein VNK04_19155, partial [Gemmataceae bacterium]|nr:hypothetical protein [Gemmataceae bacterium]
DVQQAAAALLGPEPDAARRHLQSAAERLLAAREVLYPVTIHLIDLYLADEQRLDEPWPATFALGLPLNVIASASLLEKLGRLYPERLATLRERVAGDLVEVCGGPYQEREDALLPVESQLWNLLKGQSVYKQLLDQEVRIFARKRTSAHPQLPLFLNTVGLSRAVLLAFDDGVVPTYHGTVTSWPSPDGKQVEAFTRAPYAADSPQTFFHAAHYLHRTIMQDHAATLAFLHRGNPAVPWYRDWLELSRLSPVLGQWTTLSRYLNEVQPSEYAHAASADEFHADYLSERCQEAEHRGQGAGGKRQESEVGQEVEGIKQSEDAAGYVLPPPSLIPDTQKAGVPAPELPITPSPSPPVSGFARHVRRRRRIDTAWTLLALHRSLTGTAGADPELERRLTELEDRVESGAAVSTAELEAAEKQVADRLARRLLARAKDEGPGYLVLNPCSFARRVALELEGLAGPLPIAGPVKACQIDGGKGRLVVEVPALGFAWFPRVGPPGTPPQTARMRLADNRCVRNEFFEAEVDPATGGLKAIRDHRTRLNRLGQQLVYNPGSTMRVKEVRTTANGPALGEIISEGALLDEQEQVLATFRQRFRAWLGRPVLEMRIEIYPERPPTGYAWHSYYGARFAWRDERALLLRGVNGTPTITSHTRPETPDYLEVRLGRSNTVILPGGLPFHQRHGGRMLDVILVPPGETAHAFELGIALDRDYPMQTAVGMVTPVPLAEVAQGPPHVGAAGWLFHLDVPNLVLTGLRPAPGGVDGVIARLLECVGHHMPAELRCPRDPVRAGVEDARGSPLLDASVHGDAVGFEAAPGELVHVRVDFS